MKAEWMECSRIMDGTKYKLDMNRITTGWDGTLTQMGHGKEMDGITTGI